MLSLHRNTAARSRGVRKPLSSRYVAKRCSVLWTLIEFRRCRVFLCLFDAICFRKPNIPRALHVSERFRLPAHCVNAVETSLVCLPQRPAVGILLCFRKTSLFAPYDAALFHVGADVVNDPALLRERVTASIAPRKIGSRPILCG